MRKFNTNCRKTSDQDRRGIAALEAAVVMPVMIILVLGTIEMGTALRAGTIMQSAVREAGRLANMKWSDMIDQGDTPNAKVERDIRNFVTASGLPGSDTEFTVEITHANGPNVGQPFDIADSDNDLQMMQIKLTLPYSKISLFPTKYMAGKNVSASLALRSGMGSGLSN